ncbi:PREDICTED: prenylated Rab acceptor protein 1 [Colobus angolensis palliatus]|uniref:prenylated Rab acceptor protein 1 n=1 Tax=Colobus angolensis palliatus TaxID=336983 RepID=UPI0005F52E71|nr:PREDICTED: prenylated Rab acceptor protein 1 [Colobus angolensis palliatus]
MAAQKDQQKDAEAEGLSATNVACLPPVEKARAPWLASPSCLTAASLHSSSRVTSPMLLVALAVFFGACYILYLRTLQSKLVLFGREVSPAHQYALAGGISFPFFWLAGAGSAVFWVLGATLVVIGSHAAFHQIEAVDGEELQMEPV